MILGLLERRRNRHGQMGKGGIPRSAPYKVIMGIQAMAGVIAKKLVITTSHTGEMHH